MNALLTVRGLALDIPLDTGTLNALRGVDLSLAPGETLGLVGESGSGKSLTALSILGLQPKRAIRRVETLTLADMDLRHLGETELATKVRGRVAAMIFQEPMTSLNPVLPVGRQLVEAMTVHGLGTERAARDRAVMLMERVGLAAAAERLGQYPHQFSGGQRQRLMIAMALMTSPKLLIADEPTTALDVTVQAEILRLLTDLARDFAMGLVLVTHNLGIVSRIADRVAVMYAGQVVEEAAAKTLFTQPNHPYTQGLLGALPEIAPRGGRLEAIAGIVPPMTQPILGCAFAPRCSSALPSCSATPPPWQPGAFGGYRCVLTTHAVAGRVAPVGAAQPMPTGAPVLEATGLVRRYQVKRGLFAAKRTLTAVAGVDLSVVRGETVAIVGESGCGKSTLARLLLGLEAPDAGSIELDGRDVARIDRLERARLIQPVFQDPRGSLNPRRTVAEIVRRPLEVHGRAHADTEARAMLGHVGLSRRLADAYPNALSGGQRQRVAIARALVLRPTILLCDEPTSALDVSVQAQILNLLADLKAEFGLTMVLITHDLSVVAHMADRVAVMYLGRVVEKAPAETVFRRGAHPYTRALISSALPVAPGAGIPAARIGAGFPDPLKVPPGCAFSDRCPDALPLCRTLAPSITPTEAGEASCHLLSAA